MLSRAFLASLLAAAAGWESGKTCTTDDVRTLAKKDAKLSGTALAECVILDLRGETSSTSTYGATSSPAASPSATTWASCLLRSSGTDPTASTISESSRESKIVS